MRHLSRHRSAGFTLIELMIAVGLSTIVGAMIYTVFISQNEAYRMQADMGTMQQNLRIAMEMVTRDVSTAGFGLAQDGAAWGAGGGDSFNWDDDERAFAVRVWNDFSGEGHDAVELLMMDPDRSTWARSTGAPSRLPCDTSVIRFEDPFTTASALGDRAAQYAPVGDGGEGRIMCFSPRSQGQMTTYIWEVTSQGSGGIVPVVPNTQDDYLPPNGRCESGLPQQMVCAPVKHVAYYIDSDGSDGVGIGTVDRPVLYYVPDVWQALDANGGWPSNDDIPVALGIEDLQISWCVGGSTAATDCMVDTNFTGSELDMVGSATPWAEMSAVRVAMTARTLRLDYRRTGLDGAAGVSAPIDIDPVDSTSVLSTTVDGYHRRAARTIVRLQNAVGAWEMSRVSF